METLDERIMAAWQAASADLGFRLVSPFSAEDRAGKAVLVEGYLPDFGGSEGMVIVSFARRIKLESLRLPMSTLRKESRKYDRKAVIAALSDWGWFGSGVPPASLTGGQRSALMRP